MQWPTREETPIATEESQHTNAEEPIQNVVPTHAEHQGTQVLELAKALSRYDAKVVQSLLEAIDNQLTDLNRHMTTVSLSNRITQHRIAGILTCLLLSFLVLLLWVTLDIKENKQQSL